MQLYKVALGAQIAIQMAGRPGVPRSLLLLPLVICLQDLSTLFFGSARDGSAIFGTLRDLLKREVRFLSLGLFTRRRCSLSERQITSSLLASICSQQSMIGCMSEYLLVLHPHGYTQVENPPAFVVSS